LGLESSLPFEEERILEILLAKEVITYFNVFKNIISLWFMV
jgi:hypothetical protein